MSQQIPPRKNPWPTEEEIILARWREEKIFAKTLAKKSPRGNFVFYEGPPTANAAPGVHHVLARVFKDIIVRFRTMQGYHVERKAGWDTHGLPVELQVEKQLGIKSKPQIEDYGIAKFNAECKKLVWEFKDDWEKLTERIGFWLDLKHPYVTYENDYIESVWAVIAKAHERDLLYQGHKVVPFCTRCGTALSSHEVAQGYSRISEKTVIVKFKLKSGQKIGNFTTNGDTFVLGWTTTLWTLPGNVALAINPKVTYSILYNKETSVSRGIEDSQQYKVGEQYIEKGHYILASDRKEWLTNQGNYFIDAEEVRVGGEKLVGLEYEPPFNIAFLHNDKSYKIYAANFVTVVEGTGIVHTAVMYGEDDYVLGETIGLPKHHTVGLDGKFLSEVPLVAGDYVKSSSTEQKIIDYLVNNKLLYGWEKLPHDYPFCWRCDTPLLYYAKDSWFIAMTKVKDELLRNAEAINWIPEHIKEGRFGEWLSNVKDWAISRERYWGTPLPVWVCQTGKEIKNQKSKIKNKEGCGHWQVVGSMAELKKLAGKIPDDLHRPFIDELTWPCETCGGTMTRVPEVLDVWLDSGSMPFAQYHYPFENRTLIDGEITNPKHQIPNLQLTTYNLQLRPQFPADYICEAIDQTRGWFYTLLAVSTIMGKGASYKNAICLGHLNDAKGQKMSKSKGNVVNPWDVIERYGADPLRWYLYTINQPGDAKNFDVRQIAEVNKKVFLILQNVVSFYRLFAEKIKATDRRPAVRHVLDRWILARWDETSTAMTSALEEFRVIESARPLAEFVTDLSTWYVRRSRDRFKAGDRAAVATLGYVLSQTSKLLAPFTPFFAEWLYQNVGGPQDSVHLEDWPVAAQPDHALLNAMAQTRTIVAEALAQRMAAGIKIRQPLQTLTGPNLTAALAALVKDEVNVLEYRSGTSVKLDVTVTETLHLGGMARELIRAINAQRKAAGLTLQDLITIIVNGDLTDVLAAHRDEILAKTKATGFTTGHGGTPVNLNGRQIKFTIKKIS